MADHIFKMNSTKPLVLRCRYREASATSRSHYDLSSKTVTLHYRHEPSGSSGYITTADSQLDATDLANGQITLNPASTFWDKTGLWQLYIEAAQAGNSVYFPEADDDGREFITVEITERF